MKFQPPRGTRDLMPSQFKIWLEIFKIMREVAERYGYQPIETPAFENFKMLAAKGGGGEEVKEQIYYFRDKSGRELGLRFDITAPIARIIASNPQFPKPIKYYYITRMWRYERPQKGRWREFWQLGIELIGSKEPISDAEVISVGINVLKALGLNPNDIRVFVSNRRILEGFVKSLGVPENKILDAFRAIDKKDKLPKAEFLKELEKSGIPKKNIEKVLDIVRLKGNPKEILNKAQKTLPSNNLIKSGLEKLKKICDELEKFRVLKYCCLDLGIARGLDYYTGTVFEAFEVEGDRKIGSAIIGGGRYDDLIEVYGGEPTPATGWGIGIERLVELLEKKNLLPEVSVAPKVYVAPVSKEVTGVAVNIINELRENKVSSGIDLMGRSLSSQLSYANSKGIPYVIIVGSKGLKKKQVTLKYMKTGEEREIPIEDVSKEILAL